MDQQVQFPQRAQVLEEIHIRAQQLTHRVERMSQQPRSTKCGLSFLEIKFHMLLDYLINLTYVILLKCNGKNTNIEYEYFSIKRLVEIRTVLEKIRPTDIKLRYQIDNLVKMATMGIICSETEPTLFKPIPKNMLPSMHGKQEEENISTQLKSTAEPDVQILGKNVSENVYMPPKIKRMHFYEGKNVMENGKDRIQKSNITSSMLEDLKEEYMDTPTEVSADSRAQQRILAEQKEIKAYEETYLTRLPMTKAEKHYQRKLTTSSTMDHEILGPIRGGGSLRINNGAMTRKKGKRNVKSGIAKKRRVLKSF